MYLTRSFFVCTGFTHSVVLVAGIHGAADVGVRGGVQLHFVGTAALPVRGTRHRLSRPCELSWWVVLMAHRVTLAHRHVALVVAVAAVLSVFHFQVAQQSGLLVSGAHFAWLGERGL